MNTSISTLRSPSSSTSASDDPGTPLAADGPSSVLVVDDDAAAVSVIERFLRRGGYEVRTAPDAASALAILSAKRCDVVLSDVGLPRVDGFELLRRVRASSGADVQVVLMTGDPFAEGAASAHDLGACDYLGKPFDRARLLQTVGRAAERARCSRAGSLRAERPHAEGARSTGGAAVR